MSKPSNPFAGHFAPQDPRYIITAAGGCDWPTVPAHRYQLQAPTSTGFWSWMRWWPPLFERSGPPTIHDDNSWGLHTAIGPITWAYLRRTWDKDAAIITWRVEIMTIDCYFPAIAFFPQEPGKCNGEVPLGDMSCIGAFGSTGVDMKLVPVQYDKLLPEE